MKKTKKTISKKPTSLLKKKMHGSMRKSIRAKKSR